MKVAVSYHLVARTQSCMGDFRSALTNEKETFTIYKTQLGEEHDKTRESGECLRHLTQQAVVLQKKMNDIYQGKTKSGLPPIQIQPPSMGSVLDMLNIINGILFVQISQADIENFKKEYETRQKDLPLTKQLERCGNTITYFESSLCCLFLSADMSLKAAEEAAAEASAAVSEAVEESSKAVSESPERLTEAIPASSS